MLVLLEIVMVFGKDHHLDKIDYNSPTVFDGPGFRDTLQAMCMENEWSVSGKVWPISCDSEDTTVSDWWYEDWKHIFTHSHILYLYEASSSEFEMCSMNKHTYLKEEAAQIFVKLQPKLSPHQEGTLTANLATLCFMSRL